MVRYVSTLAAAVVLAAGAAAPRTWWSGPQVTLLGSPSRDGRWLSFADPATGALAIRGLSDGALRTVAARPAGSREFAHFSVFSRDGSKIAYAWFNAEGFYELRVVSAAGDEAPVTAYRNPAAGFVQPCSWTPDNRGVLTLLFRRDNISQIAIVSAAGGAPRILRSLNWVYPKRMDVSPDGRWIVYDNFAAEGKPERTIFLLAADGSAEKRLVETPGNFLFPMWSADGRRVLFAGENGGEMELWAVDVQDGAARGVPHPVSGALGRILPLGITNSGEVFYGVRTGAQEISMGGNPIHTRFAGRNLAPAWSRDGKWLAYLSRRGTENFGEDSRALVVQELATGEERELPAHMAHYERIAWSPDGAGLLVSGSDGKGRSGLFLVRVKDGGTVPLAAEHDAPFRGWEAVWAPDGGAVYYLRGSDELRRRNIADGAESTILRAGQMRHVAIDPAGATLAIDIGGKAVRITPLAPGAVARLISFPGLTELAWGKHLLAGRGAELWRVPLDGGEPVRIPAPPDRLPGIAIAPDGQTLAYAHGYDNTEVRSFALPKSPSCSAAPPRARRCRTSRRDSTRICPFRPPIR